MIFRMGHGAMGHVDAHRVRAVYPASMPVCSFEGKKEGTRDDGTPPRLGATGQQGPRTLG